MINHSFFKIELMKMERSLQLLLIQKAPNDPDNPEGFRDRDEDEIEWKKKLKSLPEIRMWWIA